MCADHDLAARRSRRLAPRLPVQARPRAERARRRAGRASRCSATSSPRSAAGGQSWIKLGPVASFPDGETRLAIYENPFDAWPGTARRRRSPAGCADVEGEQFQVFAINCAHLGCPVRWFAQSRLFMCPCHGGVYYEDGSRASGPPPRGLFEYEYQIREGQLWVRGRSAPDPRRARCRARTTMASAAAHRSVVRGARWGSSAALDPDAGPSASRAAPPAGGTPSAAPRSPSSCCRSPRASAWPWSTSRRPTRRTRACTT